MTFMDAIAFSAKTQSKSGPGIGVSGENSLKTAGQAAVDSKNGLDSGQSFCGWLKKLANCQNVSQAGEEGSNNQEQTAQAAGTQGAALPESLKQRILSQSELATLMAENAAVAELIAGLCAEDASAVVGESVEGLISVQPESGQSEAMLQQIVVAETQSDTQPESGQSAATTQFVPVAALAAGVQSDGKASHENQAADNAVVTNGSEQKMPATQGSGADAQVHGTQQQQAGAAAADTANEAGTGRQNAAPVREDTVIVRESPVAAAVKTTGVEESASGSAPIPEAGAQNAGQTANAVARFAEQTVAMSMRQSGSTPAPSDVNAKPVADISAAGESDAVRPAGAAAPERSAAMAQPLAGRVETQHLSSIDPEDLTGNVRQRQIAPDDKGGNRADSDSESIRPQAGQTSSANDTYGNHGENQESRPDGQMRNMGAADIENTLQGRKIGADAGVRNESAPELAASQALNKQTDQNEIAHVQAPAAQQSAQGSERVERLLDLINRLDEHVLSLASGGREKSMTVHLEPPNLGKIAMNCLETDGAVRVNLLVENPVVRNLLQDQEASLRQALEQAGFRLSQFDVRHQDERSGGKQPYQNQAQGTRRNRVSLEADRIQMTELAPARARNETVWYIA